jgi:hypothetical protein
MSNPKSRGIGTGAAQVYDYSRIDRATENAMRILGAKEEAARARKAKDEAVKKKALKDLQGEYGDYDTSNIREADKQPLIDSINEGAKLMEGHWEDVVNGDPYWTNVYRNQVMNHKKFIGDSADQKVNASKVYAEAIKEDSGYSDDRIRAMQEMSAKPGVTISSFRDSGIHRRDMIVGDLFNKVDDAFSNSDTAMYNVIDKQYVNPDGGMSSRKQKVWLPDSEALTKFKTTIDGSPELQTDMSIKYGDLPLEDQYKAFYGDYKESRKDEELKTVFKATPTPKPTAGSGGFNLVGSAFTADKGEGFVIANPKKSLQPISFTVPKRKGKPETVVNLVPESFWKNKSGRWMVRGNVLKGSWNELTPEEQKKYASEEDYLATSAKGDVVNEPVNDNMAAKIEAQYGIGNLDEYLKSLKGKPSSPTAEELINKYK